MNKNVQAIVGVMALLLIPQMVEAGTIVVEKQTVPDGSAQLFSFFGDATGDIGDGQTITVSGLAAGVYSVAENVSVGWDLTSVECDDGASENPSSGSIELAQATFNLDADETVTCTFTNTQRGSIEIVKSLSADGPASKTFTFNTSGGLFFDGVGGASTQATLIPFNVDTDATTGPIEVLPGSTYIVTEADPTAQGWALLDAICSDGSSPSVGINVSPGESVVCTFTNSPLGSVTIIKNATGADGTFDFQWGSLVPEGETASFDLTTSSGSASWDFSHRLLIGYTYVLTELVPADWNLTGITCTEDGEQNSIVSLATASATLIVESGETVSCVFKNQPVSLDSDGDGVPDSQDICPAGDDGIDSDGDLVPDFCDPCPIDPDNDADGDGVCGDVDICPIGDDLLDADLDGTPDACDVCPNDPSNDADGDGVCGDVDNCPLDANTNQQDIDDDSIGDACDPDDDGDGICNGVASEFGCSSGPDNCPLLYNPAQVDSDGDGIGDLCDNDSDNDGIIDVADSCPLTQIGDTVNAEGCSISDLCPCGNDWKNHGAYVRCVAHASEDFVVAGLITEAEKDTIVSVAAQAACGARK